MTPLPGRLGDAKIVSWRLDTERFHSTWDSGEGAYQSGGRWNSQGVRAVYCSVDPAAAILEVAVHKGFDALDVVPHVLTSLTILDNAEIHVFSPEAVPNTNWLKPGFPSRGQQAFGDSLLRDHQFILIPGVVSTHSWNLIFDPGKGAGHYALRSQERFALDTRLHPAGK
jgi:RES domain-containing protein